MIIRLSLMEDVSAICDRIRKKKYGEGATARDYKDSFVINNCIDDFRGSLSDLYRDRISKLDQGKKKSSKSVNLRVGSHQRLVDFAKMRAEEGKKANESEICRRILYFADEEPSESAPVVSLPIGVSDKVELLKSQISSCRETLLELERELESIGSK